jgi:hypothetical protein
MVTRKVFLRPTRSPIRRTQAPERPHREARGEGRKREDEAGGLVDAREELREMIVASRP